MRRINSRQRSLSHANCRVSRNSPRTGLDLRGKTVQIVMTRDFRSLAPAVVEKLNEKWKDSGTVGTGVAESNTVTFRIPEEPLTRNCITLVAR